jgi:hypothetical protein
VATPVALALLTAAACKPAACRPNLVVAMLAV